MMTRGHQGGYNKMMMTTVRGRATHKVILPTFCLAGKFSSSMGFLIDVYIFKMMG
jgi:hypothetical protein